ncbi:carboxypeptidase-like regulatory domain-containing protein [uncultured Tenacibaculum sp.]|uniref:carboxypeptidase-like regulatory domain-containing protein n=1 Tax=uncultured Tenacibaculum sp. TaxID=174713 RepID=UPI00261A4DDD|nr:carboxypeptidase-like regulatory domain-containing protein [uncultured Tenacibaculum sp.]
MKKLLPFFTLVFLLSKVHSQDSRKFFYAEIKDKIGPVINAHIINLNTNQGTYTNENGEFRILVKVNDSLKLSFVGYKTKTFHIKMKHFGIQKNIINLVKTPFELNEVNLNENDLSGFLSSDSKKVKFKKEINAVTLKLPYAGAKILTPAQRKLQTAKGGSVPFTFGLANSFSLDYILNSISGRIKKLTKHRDIESLEFKVEKIKKTYSLHFTKEFGIKESDVYKFIYYCSYDKNFNTVFNSGEIDLIQFFKVKSKSFKESNPKDYTH